MADQKTELDANEPATEFKLEKARRRGSVVRSQELTFALVLIVCVACVYGLGVRAVDGTALMLRRGLAFAARDELTGSSILAYGESLMSQVLAVFAPIVLVIWIAAVLIAAVQARGVFTAQPLTPDFSRVNPAAGFKRLMSIKSLHDLWRNSAKLAAIALVAVLWGRQHMDEILSFTAQTPRQMILGGVALLGSALVLLTGVMIVFALLDWVVNRWEFQRQMRMSKREIKDEHKEREGDPRIKSRRRELRLEWLKRVKQLAKVRSADVLLTNPTHYAVALEYRHGEMPAPMITARGAGEMAHRMRREARRRNVPVVEHVPLARALFQLEESAVFVPEEHFDQVARVLRWVYAARNPGQVSA